jgi:hypothetical protein
MGRGAYAAHADFIETFADFFIISEAGVHASYWRAASMLGGRERSQRREW